ncbi:membrane-anchored ubiquitin-fold protein 6-like [Ipomoea triloba]|uniref:membrane-anchored ubiquitin-fold protein 6-like n=1 Tax=Ipomoea triloba TaxID=35885 RepID=UPI00125DCEE2|nr:membrane-anchored ubiquitin-fold protein 6-like [Ipomoea triloba]GLL18398.1 membrane-anchored ubiquitin-fold protein 6-like [Ipomoea trifida]GMC56468.1 membrane-anchored ubiquitin-fold protein 6-like [Ipomoea batatas]GMC56470.1 membrane-anchored ubiquitin-fold protein 6-like [Ipomoea batatas]GMC56472.1 membrane-anchored ubiquitin-fold protein 6-like [Ipomoea batatas]
MAAAELVDIKFRLADGTDIGPDKYGPSSTVGSLKEKIISQWPKDKENGPKTINDVKLINAGKILENSKTLAESGLPVVEDPGCLVTMHVLVRPPIAGKKSDKLRHKDTSKPAGCSCSIL